MFGGATGARRLSLAFMSTLLLAQPAGSLAEPPELRDAIVAFLEARSPETPSAIEVPPLGDFSLPGIARERIHVELSSHPQAKRVGRVPVTVALSVDGRVVRRGIVNAKVRVEVPVVVTTRPVRRGEILELADLALEPRDVSELPEGWLDDPSALVGLRARRSVMPGVLWRESWAQVPPRVRRGELVPLQLQHGSLVIQGRGVVRKDARVGEMVGVVNPDSRRELMGRVDPEGVVHVAF